MNPSPTILSLVALAVTLVPAPAQAESGETDDARSLQVLVGPGARTRDTVAVPDVRCEGASAAACSTVTGVLRRDMLLSFVFRVLPPRSYLVSPEEEPLDAVRWPDWVNVGARYLIKAEVHGPSPYRLEFRLYNVEGEETIPVAGQSLKSLSERELRRSTHRFCNGVLKAITGITGVFDTRIAYAIRRGPGNKVIGVMDMDGKNHAALVSNGSINMLPSWGFGGVLYTSFLGGKPDLYFGKRRLSRDAGHYRKVAVSRDGSKMVASISYGGQSDLYLMAKDGKVIRNLTRSGSDEVSPTFSPDGTRIAFVSSAAGGPQIYVMSLEGGGMKRLTHAGSYNYGPDWGPDGRILFAGLEEGTSDIFVTTEGGDVERLTQNQGSNKDPTWSPDGRYIAFVSRRPGGSGVYLMTADGRYQYMVRKVGGVSNVAWQR